MKSNVYKKCLIVLSIIAIFFWGTYLVISNYKNTGAKNNNVKSDERYFENIDEFCSYTSQGKKAILEYIIDKNTLVVISFDEGKFSYEGKTYKYLLKNKGIMPNASEESVFWCLCDKKIGFSDITEDLLSADSSKQNDYVLIPLYKR